MSKILGIDASRCRSGGAVNHIIGILKNLPEDFKFKEIHIWSYKKLNDQLPKLPGLIVHNHIFLEKSLFFNLIWQFFLLKKYLKRHSCDILFTADASTVCNFKPQVVLSQDLLSYEKGILKKYKISWNKIRIIIIRYIQNIAFRRSIGTIFLNNYSKNLVEHSCGKLNDTKIIPHGVNRDFFNLIKVVNKNENSFNLIYISNAEIYKNHISVLKSLKVLLDRGFNVHLSFVGGGDKNILNDLDKFIFSNEIPKKSFKQSDFLSFEQILFHLSKSDIFIFASSCESFGITLLEGMAAGLPIACSNKSSLPELLLDGGVYFNPDCPHSIADSIEILIANKSVREEYSKKANSISKEYTWERTSKETLNYIFNKTQ